MGSSNSGGGRSSGGGGGGRSSPTKKDNGTSKYFNNTSTKKGTTQSTKDFLATKTGASLVNSYALMSGKGSSGSNNKNNNGGSSTVEVFTAPAADITKVEKNPSLDTSVKVSAAPDAVVKEVTNKSFGVLKSDTSGKKSLPDVSKVVETATKPNIMDQIGGYKSNSTSIVNKPNIMDQISGFTNTSGGGTSLVDAGFTNTQNKVTDNSKDNSHRSDLFNSDSRDNFIAGSAANKAATEGAIKGKDGDRINLSADNKTVGYPHVPGVDMDTYNKIATSQKALSGGVGSFSLLGQSIKDKYTNDGVSYNQAYWAGKLAHGQATGNDNIQADLAAEQGELANPYSGARVVTDDMSKNAKDTLKRVTGSMAVVDDDKMSDKEKDDLRAIGVDVGGVTRNWERSGLLGENVKGTFKWNDGTTVVTKANNPVIGGKFNDVTGRIDGGIRLGDYTSATFAGAGNYTGSGEDSTKDGDTGKTIDSLISTGHLTGGNDGLGGDAVTTDFVTDATLGDVETGKTTIDEMLGDDDVTDDDVTDEIDEIDTLITTTTDADELKELHRRRMALMRIMRTRTRRASLLGDADVKRANLVSIL